MDSDDTVDAKRLKTEPNNENDIDVDAVEEAVITEDSDTFLQDFLSKRPQTDLTFFQRTVKCEELEAAERDPAEDLKLYHDACADFSECVNDIAKIKAEKPDGWKDAVNEFRKEAAFITLIMKKLNRIEKTRTKITREKITKEKQEVDIARVKLDNMMSEMFHLRREIDKCLKFRSKPLGIDLIPVNEFYEKAPAEISKPEITKSDDHQLQLARLEWELHQRKELSAHLSELETKRSAITEQIEKKEKDLNSIGPLVNDIISVSQPLKEKLGSSFTKHTKISEHAYLLPEPLYFLFVQASAYIDVSDKDVSVDIKGNLSDAHKFKNRFNEKTLENFDKETASKKQLEQEKDKLFTKHPLTVNLKFSVKGTEGFVFELQFFYFPNLNIATVKPSMTTPTGLKVPSSSDVLFNHKNFLHNLFSGDSGLESPNLMNYYLLQKVGLETLPLEKMGPPYIWAQKLVGLDFFGQSQKTEPRQEVARANLPIILKELKKRCFQRVVLLALIGDLEKGEIMPPPTMKVLKLSSQLEHIKGIMWGEYHDHPLSQRFRDSAYVTPNDIFFNASITRGEAKMNCLIAVKPDYPLSPSVFSLAIDYKPFNSLGQSKDLCKDIEREVNVFWKDLITSRSQAPFALSYQLFKTMVCFDIVMESFYPDQFSTNKQFESTFRGRNRALPFKYLPEENLFTHRH